MSVFGYLGPLGVGKSMLAVNDLRQHCYDAESNVLIVSNVRVQRLPELRKGYGCTFVQLTLSATWAEDLARLLWAVHETGSCGGLSDTRYIVVFLDDVGVLAWARKWQSFPPTLHTMLSQSRKVGCDLWWTGQFMSQIDSTLRAMTTVFFDVSCFPRPSFRRRRKGKRPLFMTTHRYEGEGTYRKKGQGSLPDFVIYKRERESWYDTDALIVPPGFLDDGGLPDAILSAYLAGPQFEETGADTASVLAELGLSVAASGAGRSR